MVPSYSGITPHSERLAATYRAT